MATVAMASDRAGRGGWISVPVATAVLSNVHVSSSGGLLAEKCLGGVGGNELQSGTAGGQFML